VIIFAFGDLDAASAYLGAFSIISGILVLAGVAFGTTVKAPELVVERA
jgi:hypothetical protein